jgi:hypothetical protein
MKHQANNIEPYEIMDKAADYLLEHGWCQKFLFDGEARCPVGAIAYIGRFETHSNNYFAARNLFISYFGGFRRTYKWNDSRSNVHEVVAMMRLLADISRYEVATL